MGDELKGTDFFQKDFLKDPKKAVQELSAEFEKLINHQEELLKISQKKIESNILKTASDFQALNTEIEKTVQVSKSLDDTRKTQKKTLTQIQKLQVKLVKSTGEEAVNIQKLKIQTAQNNKITKQAAREQLKLVGAYERTSKELIDNRKRLKDLAISGRTASKVFKSLQKEVSRLDRELKDVDASAGQFQRNVGDYPQTMGKATTATATWALALVGLNGNLGDVTGSLGANEEGSEELRKTQSQLGAVANTLKNRFSKLALGIFDVSKQLITGEGSGRSFLFAMKRMQNAFKGVNKEIKDNVKAAKEAEQAQINLEKSSRALALRVAVLSGVVETNNAIAGNSTKSFNEIAAAIGRANDADIERIGILRRIAAEELKIIEDRIRATNDDANRLQLLDELSARRIALQELENELAVAQIDRDKEAAENARDRFELELDFALDVFDATKTVNERRITDERKTLEERREIFDRTVQLANESFQDQIKLTEDFLGQRTNLEELALIDDQKIIRARIKEFASDEITLIRILEIIKERKFVIQDLADSERDLTDAIKERNQASIDAAQTKVDTINEIEQEQFQGSIDAIQNQLEAQKQTNAETIKLLDKQFELRKNKLQAQADFEISLDETTAEQKELIEQRLKNNIANLDAEEAQRKKDINADLLESDKILSEERNREIAQALNAIGDLVADFFSRVAQERIDSLDLQIDASQTRIQELRELAKQGSEDAENNLASEVKRDAELRAEKEEQIQAQKNLEIGLTALKTFSANVEAGDGNALGSTVAQITSLLAFVGSISGSFKDGTEDTGKVSNALDADGGRLAVLHNNERVLTAEQNMKVGGLSNEQLANLAYMHNNGGLYNQSSFDSELADHLQNIEKAVKDNKPAVEDYSYDSQRQELIHSIRIGNKIIKTIHKTRATFKC